MTDEEYRVIHKLFDDKISDLSEEFFPGPRSVVKIPPDHPMIKRWRGYLSELGISCISKDEACPREGRFKIPNPLYIEEDGFLILDMSVETADKILLLGLP